MTSSGKHVDQYLRRLEELSTGLPPADRAELLDQIRSHIDSAGAESGDVQRVLDDLGTPEEIVAAAREQSGVPAPGLRLDYFDVGTNRENWAVLANLIGVVLILFGAEWGFLAAGFAISLAWNSRRWVTWEKIVISLGTVPILAWSRFEHLLRADGPVGGVGSWQDQGLTWAAVAIGFLSGHFMRILVRRAGERSPRP